MSGSRRQWIALGVSGVAFVMVAAFRLRGHGPEKAQAVSTVADIDLRAVLDGLPSGDALGGSVAWGLPDVEELELRFSPDWQPPSANPFVMSERMRALVSGAVPQAADPALEAPVDMDDRPTFAIRSTFRLGERWYAEIDGQTYGVGDVVGAFRITAIEKRSVWFVPQAVKAKAGERQPSRPSSVIRTADGVAAHVDGQWLRTDDLTPHGRVAAIESRNVHYERVLNSDGQSRPMGIELQVGDSHD